MKEMKHWSSSGFDLNVVYDNRELLAFLIKSNFSIKFNICFEWFIDNNGSFRIMYRTVVFCHLGSPLGDFNLGIAESFSRSDIEGATQTFIGICW